MLDDGTGAIRETVVRPASRVLLRDGTAVHVEPRVFDLLMVLVEADGALVDKETMVSRVWDGRPVSDDAIAATVRDLRRALGDDGRRQEVIRTIYGRGVRIIAPVRVETDTDLALAVLPFEAPAPLAALAKSLTLDVTVAATRTKCIPVISYRSAQACEPDTPPDALLDRLGARFLLTGQVTGDNTELRLSVFLTDSRDETIIWADRWRRSLADVLADLNNLADHIAVCIEAGIEGHVADAANLKPIENLDAWGAYHRAMRALMRFQTEDAGEIDALLTHAARLAPRSARIRAAMSHLEWQRAFLLTGRHRTVAGARALGLAHQALALDDRDPQAHWVLGRAHLIAANTEAARAALRHAIVLNPSFAGAYYSLGWTMSHDGTPSDEATSLVQTARRLSPLDPMRYAFDLLEADLCFFAGDTDRARTLALGAAHHPGAHHQAKAIAAWLLHATGADEHANRLAEGVRRQRPGYGFADYCAAIPVQGLKRATVKRHFRALGF